MATVEQEKTLKLMSDEVFGNLFSIYGDVISRQIPDRETQEQFLAYLVFRVESPEFIKRLNSDESLQRAYDAAADIKYASFSKLGCQQPG